LPEESLPLMRVLHRAIEQNLVRSCHDLSEGGLAVAAAEMALAGRIGMSLDLRSMPEHSSIEQDAALLFSESNGRFLVEVSHSQQQKFERLMSGLPCALLGETVEDASLKVVGRTGEVAIEVALDDIERSWKRSLWTS
ncbi:MAG TPA: AIR synthase-related protein, partial [bacterium]|nr:AIR synthase-related protein [bacterium]